VGATGAVLAEDINPLAIEYIDKRVQKEGIANVRTVLGRPDDPMLPPESVDAVLLLKVYHEIAHPVAFMKKLRPALHPGGRVGIIDKNGDGTNHGLDHKILEKEMDEAGFKLVASHDFTKADGEDYFLVFVAK
jgi:ubiquinone/menaquinone biosynthesis C-methylase UbiE